MSNGIMMFANNGQATFSNKSTIEIDYVKMAMANAKNIMKHMTNNNVALVTDEQGKTLLEEYNGTKYFSHIIIHENKDEGVGPNTNANSNMRGMRSGKDNIRMAWKNQTRADAYNLSPFDKTLLLDADYFVFDNMLDILFDTDKNVLCGRHVEEISYQDFLIDYDRIHHQSIELYWATVLYFTKSNESKMLFDIMNWVKKNWQYFSKLYKFEASRNFSNDYAVSIAIHMLQGKVATNEYALPFKLMCSADKNIMLDSQKFVYRYKNDWSGSRLPIQNVHVMNKQSAHVISQEIING